ncbi:hypothetical protein EV641_104143 [Rhodococcus sp. SMB37]|uniref:hypothetical protein n=1 Tax=Rhodococcus sp. SMB37 TaxID=2512213 RepID=UPI000B339FB1|nr:hypothetical protein [Rhodococcus sp. SMB37]TCN54878.1 hypothetical protein EV641_104143 [Rhodococcus sp. SMB37]
MAQPHDDDPIGGAPDADPELVGSDSGARRNSVTWVIAVLIVVVLIVVLILALI